MVELEDQTNTRLAVMFRIRALKCRPFRRPATIIGAACTSAFLALFFLNKVLLNGATCVATCATNRYLSYERLQKNEAARKVKPSHPVVKNFEVNFLPSNSPIEDRFVAGISPSLGAAMFSVIDGHKGYRCSAHLQSHLLQYISAHLHKALLQGVNVKEVNARAEDLRILLDMNAVTMKDLETGALQQDESGYTAMSSPRFSLSSLQQSLREAFLSLDNNISNTALSDVQLVHQGHSFTAEFRERIMRAVEGACAIAAVVLEESISVASTGDCRVVLGRKLPSGAWKAIPLSIDQNAEDRSEVERLKAAHPGEEQTVIMGNRVLGGLMPFRTFGDVDFKWEAKHLSGLVPIPPFYSSPPYITAEPVVTHHSIEKGDRFMILASDGFWERISNEKAVKIVAEAIGERDGKSSRVRSLSSFWRKGDDVCCHDNVATKLLWEALGGTDKNVTGLLNIPPSWSRMYRDDITIMVVYFTD